MYNLFIALWRITKDFFEHMLRKSTAEVTDECTMKSIKADVHYDVLQEVLNVYCSLK